MQQVMMMPQSNLEKALQTSTTVCDKPGTDGQSGPQAQNPSIQDAQLSLTNRATHLQYAVSGTIYFRSNTIVVFVVVSLESIPIVYTGMYAILYVRRFLE